MAINGAGAAEREAQRVWSALDGFRIEVPSWGFANTGTRFGKFVQGGAATTIEEKFSDAAQVNARPRVPDTDHGRHVAAYPARIVGGHCPAAVGGWPGLDWPLWQSGLATEPRNRR